MKILHLTLKKKWFDMIASGEKKEEYREIKIYWMMRLCKCNGRMIHLCDLQQFDAIRFVNGYGAGRPALLVKCAGISYGIGRPEWGGEENKEVFIIKLGKILRRINE